MKNSAKCRRPSSLAWLFSMEEYWKNAGEPRDGLKGPSKAQTVPDFAKRWRPPGVKFGKVSRVLGTSSVRLLVPNTLW